ncbi:MAG: flagellar hook-basal body complex protein FliE [Spirochaetales bacterium]|nr:flagellar hook-basal body complex protein FliE [Spirochaetales bacterium]
MSLLNILNESAVSGNFVGMKTTNSLHMKAVKNSDPREIPAESAFADLVKKGLNAANQDQLDSQEIFVKMITEPDSVEAHDVSIAMAKANMSLQMTKSIVDKAVQAYKDIINMR